MKAIIPINNPSIMRGGDGTFDLFSIFFPLPVIHFQCMLKTKQKKKLQLCKEHLVTDIPVIAAISSTDKRFFSLPGERLVTPQNVNG